MREGETEGKGLEAESEGRKRGAVREGEVLRQGQAGTASGSQSGWRRGDDEETAPTRGGAGRAAAVRPPPRLSAVAGSSGRLAARLPSCLPPGYPALRPRRKRPAGAARRVPPCCGPGRGGKAAASPGNGRGQRPRATARRRPVGPGCGADSSPLNPPPASGMKSALDPGEGDVGAGVGL